MTKTVLVGLTILVLLLIGCTIPDRGNTIRLNIPNEIKLNETKGLEDQSVWIKLESFNYNRCTRNSNGSLSCTEMGTSATFLITQNVGSDLPTPEPQPITIGSGQTRALPFTNYTIKVVEIPNAIEGEVPDVVTILVQRASSEQGVWMQYRPVQCGNNPWEAWHRDLNRQYVRAPTEQEILTEYYQTVYAVSILDYQTEVESEIVCQACSCPRGDLIKVKISPSDEQKMRGLGWQTVQEPPGEEVTVAIDQNRHSENDANIQFTITNTSNRPIFIQNGCPHFFTVEKKNGNTWQLALISNPRIRVLCAQVPLAEMTLQPNQSKTFDWQNPTFFNGAGNMVSEIGTYRVVVQYSTTNDGFQAAEPFTTIYSNSFEIRQAASSDRFEVEYGWSGGMSGQSETIKLEDQELRLEKVNGFGAAERTESIQTIPLSSAEWDELKSFFENSGITNITEADLNDCRGGQLDCPTDLPSRILEVKLGTQETSLQWYYLLSSAPTALQNVLEKMSDLRERFEAAI